MWTDQLKNSFDHRIRNGQIQLRICPYCGNTKFNIEFNIEKCLFHSWCCEVGGTVEKFFRQQNLPYDNDKWQSSNRDIQFKKEIEKISMSSFVVLDGNRYGVFLKSRGLALEDIETYGLRLGVKDKYKEKIIIPLYEGDTLVSFVARDTRSGMYMNPIIEKSKLLPYYLGTRNKYTAYLCEGALDAISINKLGFTSAVLLGTIISRTQIQKIKDFGFKEVVIALDGDVKDKAMKMHDVLEKEGVLVKIIFFDKKDDPNSLFVRDRKKLEETLLNPKELTLVARVSK